MNVLANSVLNDVQRNIIGSLFVGGSELFKGID